MWNCLSVLLAVHSATSEPAKCVMCRAAEKTCLWCICLHSVGLLRYCLCTCGLNKGIFTKSDSQLLALVSFVFRDKILKHIHTY